MLLVPGLMTVLIAPGWEIYMPVETIAGMATAWACVGIMMNIPLCAMAVARLSHPFRDRIARSDVRGWDRRRAWRALSSAGRRRPIPTGEMLAKSVR